MTDLRSTERNALTLVLFGIYVAILCWLVLFKLQFSLPVTLDDRVINLIPLAGSFRDDGTFRFGEIRNNMLAFLPLGIYLCLLKGAWPFAKKVLVIAALTLGFETAQFVFAIGRADITDVLSNTLGGIVGLGVYALLRRLMNGKTDRVLRIAATALTCAVLALIAFLLASGRWIRIL